MDVAGERETGNYLEWSIHTYSMVLPMHIVWSESILAFVLVFSYCCALPGCIEPNLPPKFNLNKVNSRGSIPKHLFVL